MAGPVVACACLFPFDAWITGVTDSKKLSPKQRGELFLSMQENQKLSYGLGVISPETIDKINILEATKQAMYQALDNLPRLPDFALIDAVKLPHLKYPSKSIIKGDCLSYLIGAASIIAKETRDRMMQEYHEAWPEYGFNKHKGYGTKQHLEALEKYGPTPIHRLSFAPVAHYRRLKYTAPNPITQPSIIPSK